MLLDLSCLSYPLPPDVRRLYEAGDFGRMELVIRRRLDDPCVPEALKARLRVQLEMAYEIPRAYPYTRAQMLDILQKNVSGFAEEELETLARRRHARLALCERRGAVQKQRAHRVAQDAEGIRHAGDRPRRDERREGEHRAAERDDCQNEGERRRARAV